MVRSTCTRCRATCTTLGTNDLAVWKSTAEDNKLAIGDKVPVVFPDSGKHMFTVKAIYAEEGPTGGYAISLAAFNANVPDKVDNFLLVDTAKGYSSSQARTAIEKVLHNYPNATVRTQDEFKGTIASQIDQMLNLVYVLLFMALVIALFGIANTLALSVFERTREIGLLRAVGMSRKQVRQSVRWESVLIALLGTTLGTAIGLGFGWALVHSLGDKGIGALSIPRPNRGDDARLVGQHHELGAVARVELRQQPAHVGLGGRVRHEELLGDLRVRQAAGDRGEHLALALGQRLELGRGVPRCGVAPAVARTARSAGA